MASRIPEHFRAAFAELARGYGDVALADACAQLLLEYATIGARAALTKRKGDKSEACPRCRERDAIQKQIRETLARTTGPAVARGTHEEG